MRVVFEFEDCRKCPYRRVSLTYDWECTKQGSRIIHREGAKTVFGYKTLEEMFENCPIKEVEE